MNLAMAYFFEENAEKIDIARQLDVPIVVTNCSHKGDVVSNSGWDFSSFIDKVHRFEDEGLKVKVLEGPTPLDSVKLGLQGKEKELETFVHLIELLDRMDIRVLCYNWMPIIGWYRSRNNIITRGGATVTGFHMKDVEYAQETDYGRVENERLWETLECFLQIVLPVCEEHSVQLALHPDDPPVHTLFGIDRILTSKAAFDRVLRLVESPMNGITLCQGSFAAMGEPPQEMIRYFGNKKKIHFAHFRDIKGTTNNFHETFHDDGQTNMKECIQAYYDVGYTGYIRPDHVPTMKEEHTEHPGYSNLGNLYAIGYMRGLMEGSNCHE